jgi:hypothetical protein
MIRSTSRKSVSLSSDEVCKAPCECIQSNYETPGRTHTHLPAFAFKYAQCAASHDFSIHSLPIQSVIRTKRGGDSVMSYPDSLPTHIGADISEEKIRAQTSTRRPDAMTWVCVFTGIFATIGYYDRYWLSSSVPVFIGLAMFMVLWVCLTWTKRLLARQTGYSMIDPCIHSSPRLHNTILYTSTALVVWWALISMVPGYESLPSLDGNGDKYFIAINLHNNKAILPDFTHQLTSLAQHSEHHLIHFTLR